MRRFGQTAIRLPVPPRRQTGALVEARQIRLAYDEDRCKILSSIGVVGETVLVSARSS